MRVLTVIDSVLDLTERWRTQMYLDRIHYLLRQDRHLSRRLSLNLLSKRSKFHHLRFFSEISPCTVGVHTRLR